LARKVKVGGRPDEAMQSAGAVKFDADAVRGQLERLLASQHFHGSKRCSSLLRYIVDKTLAGKLEDLKERVVGIEVFGRTADYDTSVDATVRVSAVEVRKRLALYYRESGHQQELRIDVPAGSYMAEFRRQEEKPLPEDGSPLPSRQTPQYWYIVAPLALAILVVAGWGVRRALFPASAIDKFWAPLLHSAGPVFICIDAPPVNPLTLKEASNSNHPAGSNNPAAPGNVQVALNDISAADDLVSYLHKRGKDSSVRPARDTSLSDLRSSPVVLFGLFDNAWVRTLEGNLRFRIREDADAGRLWIEDTNNPADQKWSVPIVPPPGQAGETDYALLSRVRDQSTGQWWIGITGLTGRATKVAHQALFDPAAMNALTAGFPKHWEQRNLQTVLEIKKGPSDPGTFRVIATWFR
jgi:hypothetical protein